MNLIDVCIITIIVSLTMRLREKLDIYKMISDLGYKFNIQRFNELLADESIQINIITRVLDDYYMYIPFYNLLVDAARNINYDEQIDLLTRQGALEKMTTEEQKEYNEHKSGYYAIKMEKRKIEKLKNASLAAFKNGSKIWFNFKENIEETDSFTDIIEIVEVSGPYNKLTIEELKQKVYYSLIIVGNHILEEEQNINEKTNKENEVVEEVVEIPLYSEAKENNKPKTRIRKK